MRHSRPNRPGNRAPRISIADSLVVKYGDTQILHFRYLYVALKSHHAESFAKGDNPLAAALVGLMKCGNLRAEIKVWAADTIRRSATTDWEKYLLLDCLDAYLTLNPAETVQNESMLATEPYQETKAVIQTIFDKSRAEGRQEGRDEGRREGREEAMRRICLALLRKRFGAVPAEVAARIDHLSSDRLADLALEIPDCASLDDLRLDTDDSH